MVDICGEKEKKKKGATFESKGSNGCSRLNTSQPDNNLLNNYRGDKDTS